jgi:hypothetical protein
MYGASSVVFNHVQFFRAMYEDGVPQWTVRFDREYQAPPLPAANSPELQAVGAKILQDNGIQAPFRANLARNGSLIISQGSFLAWTRYTYWPEKHRLVAEDRRFRLDQTLLAMHAREGLKMQGGFANRFWGVVGVDLVVLAMLIWVASGIYMWWHIPQVRMWGWAALAGGLATFFYFVKNL